MYAVIHGGTDNTLRSASCAFLSNLPFDGFAIGGSMGKTKHEMFTMLEHLMPQVPTDKPNHLLGIGDTQSLEHCVALGIDTFDSSHPTRCARHGLLFTEQGPIKIMHAEHKNSFEPVSSTCTCYTCAHYTRAYLRHLFKAHELSAYTLTSIHNIHFMIEQMKRFRQAILADQL